MLWALECFINMNKNQGKKANVLRKKSKLLASSGSHTLTPYLIQNHTAVLGLQLGGGGEEEKCARFVA